MARNRIFYGLFLLAAVVFHSFYTGWFSFFLLLFSVLLPVFSLLVSLPAMLRAAYAPQLPLRCFCGQDVQFVLRPLSVSRLPVSCCRLHLLVCDAVGGTQQAEWLTLAGTLRFSLRVDTRHAGQQTFRVDRARVYDALGLVGLPLQLPTRSCRISASSNTVPIIQSRAAAFPRSTICANTARATACMRSTGSSQPRRTS